jgi:hypothetical protein
MEEGPQGAAFSLLLGRASEELPVEIFCQDGANPRPRSPRGDLRGIHPDQLARRRHGLPQQREPAHDSSLRSQTRALQPVRSRDAFSHARSSHSRTSRRRPRSIRARQQFTRAAIAIEAFTTLVELCGGELAPVRAASGRRPAGPGRGPRSHSSPAPPTCTASPLPWRSEGRCASRTLASAGPTTRRSARASPSWGSRSCRAYSGVASSTSVPNGSRT